MTDQEENLIASISYAMYSDDDDIIIDVAVSDYNEESVDAISKILDTLSKESATVQTIAMIREGLVNNGHEELLIPLLTKIGKNFLRNTSQSDKPCISPSDML